MNRRPRAGRSGLKGHIPIADGRCCNPAVPQGRGHVQIWLKPVRSTCGEEARWEEARWVEMGGVGRGGSGSRSACEAKVWRRQGNGGTGRAPSQAPHAPHRVKIHAERSCVTLRPTATVKPRWRK